MGGRIWLDSELGKGSSFHFTAEVGIIESTASTLSAERIRPAGSTEVVGPDSAFNPRKLRVLLAEDNVVNQKLASRLLEKRGHTVVTVGSGREAVRALQTERFDLVLMDVQMPDIDGLEATAAIRAQEHALDAHTPIIAMTAHAMAGDRERCLAAGMDGYVSKPIQAKELFAAIEAVFAPAETLA
jgi:CheY-like chemotaxis protein